MPNEYRVVWAIDIMAGSARQAARCARDIQLDPDSLATFFDVADAKTGKLITTVDLSKPARKRKQHEVH